jgi:hypothetical protein
MQERQSTRGHWPGRYQPIHQRTLWIFWGVIALVLFVGLGRIVANPDQSNSAPVGAVIISEFGAASSGPSDEYGETPDWIELQNRSLRPVNLAGWVLTDDATQPDKWRFGEVILEPGAYLVVFASGRDQDQPDEDEPFIHTSFRLDSAGGYLALYPPTSRRFIDGTIYEYPAQFPQTSYGLVQDANGKWSPRYLTNPTPGAANDTTVTWAEMLPPVSMSVPHGIYDAPISVALTHPISDTVIYYTTDGTTPSAEAGMRYTEPIAISQSTPLRAIALLPDHGPAPVMTQSYIFLDDVRNQPADPAGWPETWGIHSLSRGPYVAGTPVEADYAMDARIVNDPTHAPLLEEGLLAIPTISLVTDMANLDIFATPQDRGRETERPVSVEWIDPSGDEAGFQVNAGLRIQGNAGRLEYIPKHSFRLFFRQMYGASKLEYPLFPNSHVQEFETLVLRAGVNRSFAGDFVNENGDLDLREKTTYLRDEWVRSSQIAISGTGSHGRFAHLYVNGLYWGLYNLAERPDASFAASYLGGHEDEWTATNHGGPVSGPMDRFEALIDLARAGGMEDPAKYATLMEFFDPAQFSDYMILNWFAGNVDWPETNWYATVHNPAGRNYFWVWDAEATWDKGAKIVLGGETKEGSPYPNVVKLLFAAAWANPDFRMTFADRLYQHLYNGGALTDATSRARWRALQSSIASAIVAEAARWGDARYAEPITLMDWQQANADVLAQMEGNAARLIQLARKAGYYPPINPPAMSPTGRYFMDEVKVTLTSAIGKIYYTLDGSDPRTPVTGEPAPTSQIYNEPLLVTTTGTLRARVLVNGVWSALHTAEFVESSERAQVVINEIMYNPYMDEQAEFLELKNVGNTAADLSGAYFDGIDFHFVEGTTLDPGQHLVLIRDLEDFRRRYAEAEVFGQYAGKLSDKGETLLLYSARGELLSQATYSDNYGWPLSADGAGDSLVLVDPAGDMNSPHNWRASATLYGTPGADEAEAE